MMDYKGKGSIELKANDTYPLGVLCAPGDAGAYFMTLTQAVETKIWSTSMMQMMASTIANSLRKQVEIGFERNISNEKVDLNVTPSTRLDTEEITAVNDALYGLGPAENDEQQSTMQEATRLMRVNLSKDAPQKVEVEKKKRRVPKGVTVVTPTDNVVTMGGKKIDPSAVAKRIVAGMSDEKIGSSYYVTPFQAFGWTDRMNNVILSLKSLSDTIDARATDEDRVKRDAFMKANYGDADYAKWSTRYFWLVKSQANNECLFIVMLSYAAGLFGGEPVKENSLQVDGTLASNILPYAWGQIWASFVNKVNPKTIKAGDWDGLMSSYTSNGIAGMTINQVWDSKTFQFVVVAVS